MRTFIRPWLYSVVTCVGGVAAAVAVMQAQTGRWEHAMHNVADITAGVALLFALVATFILAPVCLLLGRVLRLAAGPRVLALVCLTIAPVTCVAFRIALAESSDPQTGWAWLQYWVHHPIELTLGGSPFLLPGAVFGLSWSAHAQRAAAR